MTTKSYLPCLNNLTIHRNRVKRMHEDVMDILLKKRTELGKQAMDLHKRKQVEKSVESAVQAVIGFEGCTHVCQSQLIDFHANRNGLAQYLAAFELSRITKELANGKLSREQFDELRASPSLMASNVNKELEFKEGAGLKQFFGKLQQYYDVKYDDAYELHVFKGKEGERYFGPAVELKQNKLEQYFGPDNKPKRIKLAIFISTNSCYGVVSLARLFHDNFYKLYIDQYV